MLASDHSSRQELAVDGKTLKRIDGKWKVEDAPGSYSSDEVFVSPCIGLRDNPKDFPSGVRQPESSFGKEVSSGFPIQRDRSSRMFLVIDEQENGLKFTKQEGAD